MRVIKRKRGNKNSITLVVGLELYGVNLKDISKIMGKKFACGASVGSDDKHGECISI